MRNQKKLLWSTAIVGCLCGLAVAWMVRPGGQRTSPSTKTLSSPLQIVSEVSSRITPSAPRPTLAEVLSARPVEVFAIAGRFLKDADVEEVLALAETWEFKVSIGSSANAWKLLLGRLVAFDPDAALKLGQRLKANGYYDDLAGFILQTWFTHDSGAALAHAETDPFRLLPSIITGVARRDMTLALDLLHRHPGIPALAQQVLQELGKTDPLGAIGKAEGIVDVRMRGKTLYALLYQWTKRDPDAVLAHLETHNAAQLRLNRAVLRGLVEAHPDKAERALAILLPPGRERLGIFETIVTEKAKTDPSGTLEWAQRLPAGPERMTALAVAAKAVTEGVPERVLAMLDDIGWENAGFNLADGSEKIDLGGHGGPYWGRSGGGIGELAKNALFELAKTDPEGAMEQAMKIPANNDAATASPRTNLLEDMAQAWSAADVVGYVDWLDHGGLGTIPGELRPRLEKMPLEQVDSLESRITELEPGDLKFGLQRQLADRLAESEPARAFDLASGLAAEDEGKALVSVVKNVARSDIEQALEFFDRLPSTVRQEVTTALTYSLVEADFEQARQWFESVPETDRGVSAYGAMTREWVTRDSIAASEWVANLPQSANRDSAASTLVSHLISADSPDLDSAMHWAESIGDQSQRDLWLSNVFGRLLKDNPEAGREAVGASSLPEEAKQKLLER